MAINTYNKGEYLFATQSALSTLGIVMKGTVSLYNDYHTITLEKGDCIGAIDIANQDHSFTYIAETDCSILTVDYEGPETLANFLQTQKDWPVLLVSSITNQALELIKQEHTQHSMLSKLSQFVLQAYAQYRKLCQDYRLPVKALPTLKEVQAIHNMPCLEPWLYDYFDDIRNLPPDNLRIIFQNNLGLTLGHLMNTDIYIQKITTRACELHEHRDNIVHFLISPDEFDLMSLYGDLYRHSATQPQLKEQLDRISNGLFSTLAETLRNMYEIYPHMEERILQFKEMMEVINRKIASHEALKASSSVDYAQFKRSLATIMEFAKFPKDEANALNSAIIQYKQFPDKTDASDELKQVRATIASLYFDLYEKAFFESMHATIIPPVVKMFFYFSYLDEDLCEMEHVQELYSIASLLDEQDHPRIFTFYHWLTAIYQGKAEPCMNEFEVDYTTYIQQLKATHKIDAREAADRLADTNEKVRYELQNMFPSVMKITFGSVSSYCPVLSEHLIAKELGHSQMTTDKIDQAIQNIRTLDPTAYYQETMYENTAYDIQKEVIHLEYIPNVILLPSMGIRGVLWQDIEGRKRSSSARIMVPIFYLLDVNSLFTRITGEYRWQICKRIQGSRWNSVADPSLTSEYCDYIQFYRKNKDLSAEVKERIKTALARARNNYRECFIQDYIEYIDYESKGSPRLNKVARKILLTYCPFPQAINKNLAVNPLYTDLLSKQDLKRKQKAHRLTVLERKIAQSGHALPDELIAEQEFYNL